jgi:aryl-alcohol dehydrogenase-like predicted oxidoreductase
MQRLELRGIDGPIAVSRLVLGTDYFGSGVDREIAFQILDEYVAAGGNMLDTARFYADWVPGGHGASERTIAQWLAQSGARSRVLISTKGGHPRLNSMQIGRLGFEEVSRDLEQSLEALQVDLVDVYWLHRDDETQPVEKIMDMLAAIASNGAIRAIGCSNWRAERVEAANRYATQQGIPRFCASQLQWSLALSSALAQEDPTRVVMDDAELQRYRTNRIPVIAYTSQAKGFFARPLHGVGVANEKSLRWFLNPTNLARRERVHQLSRQTGLSATAIVLGHVLNNGIDAMALIGPRTIAQLQDTMLAADVALSPGELAYLMNAQS